MSLLLVGEDGFEPSKALPADLQSVPFGHSGIPPYELFYLSRFSEQSPAQRVCEEKENGGSGYKAFAASAEAECSELRLTMELVDGFEPPTC